MRNTPDQIEYRGWRVLVTSPLGFYALALLLIVPTLGAIALTAAPIREVAFAALILFPIALIALVTALAVYLPEALRGSKGPRGRHWKSSKQRRLTGLPAAGQPSGAEDRAPVICPEVNRG